MTNRFASPLSRRPLVRREAPLARHRASRWVGAATFGWLVLTATMDGRVASARAQGAAAPQSGPADDGALEDAAADLHNQARAALREGDYGTCFAKSRAAWAIHEHPQVAAIHADCAARSGRDLDAVHFAQIALGAISKGPVHNRMTEVVAASGSKVGRLTVALAPADATLTVDGAPAQLDRERGLYLEPGDHDVTAKGDGYAPVTKTVTATAGETTAITLRLTPLTAAGGGGQGGISPSGPPSTPGDGDSPSVPLWATLTVGAFTVGAFTAAGVLHGLHDAEVDDVARLGEQLGPSPSACAGSAPPAACADKADAIGRVENLSNWAGAMYVVGGIGALATLGMVVGSAVGDGDDDDATTPAGTSTESATEAALRNLTLAPYAGPTAAGLTLSTSW